jgi:2-aminoadipate transaminase
VGKRQQLLDVAEKYNLLIIEDDPYGEIYFEPGVQQRLAPVRSFDQHERVIYVFSFSKILAPGLRAGWILASPSVVEKIDLAKQASDLCGSMLDQRIVAECWKQGIILEHLPQIRAFYKSKAQVMLKSLKRYMPSAVRWTQPKGGLFLWITLPHHLNSETLLLECLENEKVSYVIGQPFHVNGDGSHTLRLAFSKENEDNIALGIERLARVFKSHLG